MKLCIALIILVSQAAICFARPVDPEKQVGKTKGRDNVVVNVPLEKAWAAISDSKQLGKWGPPVKGVEILFAAGETSENVGTKRRVDAVFGKKKGYFIEHRTEHEPLKRIAYKIDENTFGLEKVIRYPGFALDLEQVDANQTRIVFTFYHKNSGFFGWLMSPMVKSQQKKNRRAALKSLKTYLESGQ